MTKEEKQRKVKIIGLIMLCNWVKMMKKPSKTPIDAINYAIESSFWIVELSKLSQPLPKYPKGGVIVGENKQPETIIKQP